MKIENRIIEVSNNSDKNFWQKRVLVCIKNGKAICWNGAETLEEATKTMSTSIWDYWKEIPESKYRPFTWEERDKLRGKWIRYKKLNLESQISGLELFDEELLVTLHRGVSIKSEKLLEYYEFVDGTPCGVLKIIKKYGSSKNSNN